jgi:hypothetical protein
MGGLNSAYFGAVESDVFHKIAIQSPAFSYNSSIYSLYDKSPTAPLEIFMTAGTINDGNGGTSMNAILAEHGYDFTFTQANEGHSWGNWRGQLGEMLIGLVGPPPQGLGDFNGDRRVDAGDYTVWQDTQGTATAPGLGADGNGDGSVDTADYAVWKARFGKVYDSAGSRGTEGNQLAVPEPASSCLISVGAASALVSRYGFRLRDENSSCSRRVERRQLMGRWRCFPGGF